MKIGSDIRGMNIGPTIVPQEESYYAAVTTKLFGLRKAT